MIGQVLGGAYRVLDRVGSGGSAAVYLARDTRANTVVAVKVLHPHLAADRDAVRRFLRETEIVRRLANPHVVRVLDAGEAEGVPFIVMEYVQGLTLDQLARRRGPLPPREALGLICQALDGLAAAHALGIVHEDIKPHNLMLAPDGVLRVMDFGIARQVAAATLTQSGHIIGTPQYMAPEQVRGVRVDARSDLYSLGVTLFELLTGRVPFSGDTPWAVLSQVASAPPPPLRALRPELPQGMEAALARALAKEPAERYQGAAEMRGALLALGADSGPIIQDAALFRSDTAGRPGPAGSRLGGRGGQRWLPVAAPIAAVGMVLVALLAGRQAPTPETLAAATAGPGAPTIIAASPTPGIPAAVGPSATTPAATAATPAATAATPAAGDDGTYSVYEVGPHESLGSIAATFDVSVQDLRRANAITTSDELTVGQKLRIPAPRRGEGTAAASEPPAASPPATTSPAPPTLVPAALLVAAASPTPLPPPSPTAAPTATAPPPSPTVMPAVALPGRLVIVRSNDQGGRDLFALDPASGALARLTSPSRTWYWAPAISPDGNRLVCVAGEPGAAQLLVLGEGARSIAFDSSLSPGSPAWLPDGRIGFTASDGTASEVYAYDPSSRRVERMTSSPDLKGPRNPSWSGPGAALAFNADAAGLERIFVTSGMGGWEPISPPGWAVYAPTWSPDGARLAFQVNRGPRGEVGIGVMDVNGANFRVVVPTGGGIWTRAPAWSPDGRWLAYVSNREASDGEDDGDVYVVPAGGGESRRLTFDGRTYDWRPAWGP